MAQSSKTKLQIALTVTLAVALIGGIYYAPEFSGKIAYAVNAGQLAAERDKLATMSNQDTLSPLFRQVAKVVMPAVVEVRVTKRVAVPQMPDMDEFMRRFFQEQPGMPNQPQRPRQPATPQHREMRGLGSGVVIDAQNGYVLTNNHVVGGADQVEVVTADNEHLEAEWVKTDPATDLAVVKIKKDGLVAAPLGDSDAMQVGDLVLAIGSPENLPRTVTMGIISAKGRNQAGLGGGLNLYQNFLQTDAAINHGNSGGPLVNMKGEVIGVNTAIVSRTGVNEGIGLAIPSNMVKQILDQLIAKGKVVRGYMGVRLQDVDASLAKSFNLPNTEGALAAGVAPDGPAEKAGIKAGDFIVSVDGKKITDVNQLRMMVATIAPGKTVKMGFYREGKLQSADVKVGEQPSDMTAAFTGQESPGAAKAATAEKFGIKVAAMTPDVAERLGYKAGA
jgi:serine protease Do